MHIVATICSKEKSDVPHLIPARERYLGEHIKLVAAMAANRSMPLYFLSGLVGLIGADYKTHYYDHRLMPEGVDELARRVIRQLAVYRVRGVLFYYEPKQSWQPYLDTIKKATSTASVALDLHELPHKERA